MRLQYHRHPTRKYIGHVIILWKPAANKKLLAKIASLVQMYSTLVSCSSFALGLLGLILFDFLSNGFAVIPRGCRVYKNYFKKG